jgi:hypothetical protein
MSQKGSFLRHTQPRNNELPLYPLMPASPVLIAGTSLIADHRADPGAGPRRRVDRPELGRAVAEAISPRRGSRCERPSVTSPFRRCRTGGTPASTPSGRTWTPAREPGPYPVRRPGRARSRVTAALSATSGRVRSPDLGRHRLKEADTEGGRYRVPHRKLFRLARSSQGRGKVVRRASDLGKCHRERAAARRPAPSSRRRTNRRVALTSAGGEHSACRSKPQRILQRLGEGAGRDHRRSEPTILTLPRP